VHRVAQVPETPGRLQVSLTIYLNSPTATRSGCWRCSAQFDGRANRDRWPGISAQSKRSMPS
jgi:hypothetical protein